MKDVFSEFYQPSEADFAALWKDCIVAFDANALLNLYYYSNPTTQTFLSVMQLMKDRLWLPYQAGLEYQRNRLGVLSQIAKSYAEIKISLNKICNQIQSRTQPPFLEAELARQYHATSDAIIASFDHASSPARSNSDGVRDQLDTLFSTRVGNAFTDKQLEAIFKEGRERYKAKVPPGFKDEKKPGNDAFGDLVIWKELINKSKADKKPAILIIDDAKEDWWLIHDDRTIGPRPELLREFAQETGQRCYLYNSEAFLRYANLHLSTEVDATALDELRDASLRDRLLDFELGFEDMPTPIDIASDALSARLDEAEHESDQFFEMLAQFNRFENRKRAEAYLTDFLPKVSPAVQTLRADLASAIALLLKVCRTCEKWDERSEYKLPSWLEYVDEEMIPYTSLPKLRKIKTNLEELLRRHQDSTTS